MPTVKMLANGQILVPAEMRKKYHIELGTATPAEFKLQELSKIGQNL